VTPKQSRPHMPGYGIATESEGMLPWSFVEEQMAKSRNYWIGSTKEDNHPHVAPVWGLWHEGAFYFSTGPASQKGRNLANTPAVNVHLESGEEVVVFEGTVEVVSDKTRLKALDKDYKAKYGLPMQGPGSIFVLKPARAFAWRESNFPTSATRWTF
jgi:general stress protein 26